MAVALLQKNNTEVITIRPQAGPQEKFLSSPADICIYGGAAGGGKTWGLLLEAMRHVGNSQFGAVIFRRTSPQITNEGGMWDESRKLYPLAGAVSNSSYLYWRFPSGAKVRFSHLVHEESVYDWQGSQIGMIGFDELTHFTMSQFFYMLSRNRSMAGPRPYVRATTNPDADSWVAELIAWWINQDTGFPIPERSGVVRWFVRVNDKIEWADTRREIETKFPGHDAKSLTFISANVYDNKILLALDPGYLANLMAQSYVEQQRLLAGNWKVKPAAGKLFNRGWFEIVAAAPYGGEECRGWDIAATEKAYKGNDPDYTSGTKIRKVGGLYFVMHSLWVQEGPAEVDRLLLNITKQDAQRAYLTDTYYRVRWEIEPGASGVRDSARLVQMLDGYDAVGVRPEGDKVTRARAFAAQAFAGNVKIVSGDDPSWIDAWLSHMHGQPDLPHDDIMDGSTTSYNELANNVGTDDELVDEMMNYTGR